ncbi:amino acid adenylation domain-containing protein [Aldersonia sp. NBC_00410]|uniref:non-ribosomal peptide synthetase n=1 Tax=Aldersonia sp. NBC_00410 TaxID=2975954 RepID=UPI00225C2438|nr:non-ribosomal peptide synthetase [Aldersonia sp. NBC_00410]MCX5045886.1 amino acid adenylation domain-containing protein [Aldersonia sp. NBC_00410]
MPQLLTAAVDTARDHPAVVFEGATTSYQELDERSSQLARELIARGIGPGQFVALGLTRSLESVLALWAVAKTGAGFVPVDPNYPADRIEYMVEDSGAILGITVAAHRDKLPESSIWLVLDDPETKASVDEAARHPISHRDRIRQPDVHDAAYVIYTSGSTGRPKGVVVTHSGLPGVVAAEREHYGVTAQSRMLHVCSPSFDVSVLELLLAFTAGATLVVAPASAFGGDELAGLLERERVSHILITPGALSTVDPSDLPDLKVVVVAGESFAPELVARWAPGRRFYNGYGPTEATILSVSSRALTPGENITIGVPIAGVGALVLDHRLRPVPAGAPGELYLAGAQLARGYHRRPGLSAERFVANPYGEPGDRLYRTGDVVRWTSEVDGAREIEYVGRNDFQVKIRGFRIELGEIDAALSAHDHVEFAVTMGHSSSAGAVSLVSYVVAPQGISLDTEELSDFVGQRVPAYMVPSVIMVIDEVPLTPVGKLDRKALPEPVFAGEVEYRAPRTPVEQVIADVFGDVLGLENVGVHDSFFGLGGDSIVSIQVVSRAKARGVLFTPRDVFEHRTVAGIAAVAEAVDATAAPVGPTELAGGGVGEMPPTPIVRFMVDRPGHFGRFNQTMVLELPVGIERSGIVSTLAALVDRHDMLRARLVAATDGSVRAVAVAASGSVDVDALVHRVEVTGEMDSAETTAAADAAYDAALGRLDPFEGIVLQFVWLDQVDSARAGRLIFVAHHLVMDGVSWRIVIPDLVGSWAQLAGGATPQLPDVPTSMRAWSHALVDDAQRPERVAELPVWQDILAGADTPIGPRRFDQTVDVSGAVRSVRVELDADDTDTLLTRVPEIFHGGANDGLLASLALALATWQRARGVDERSTLVWLEGHGREESAAPGADLSRTVGWFTSRYPVRLDTAGIALDEALAGGPATGLAVQTIKEQLRAVPDNGIGYGLLRYLNDETAGQLPALAPAEISFNYLGRISAADLPDEIGEMGWIPAGDVGPLTAGPDPDMPAMAALDINAIVTGGVLSATFAFPDTLLDEADVRTLADVWRDSLHAIAVHARTVGAGGRTPSDFRLAARAGATLTQADVNEWDLRYPGFVDVWPLAPLQSGLMYHAMMAAASVDVYTVQVVVELEGDVDPDRLRVAGQGVLDRYPNLHTAFVTDQAGEPLQVVQNSVRLPWTAIDLTGNADVDAAFRGLLDGDMQVGFDLAEPPLIRFMLVTLGAGRNRLVVTNHHLLLDGWSMPLVLRELLVLYATSGDASALAAPPPYRNYVSWLVSQDPVASRRIWHDALAGVPEPTVLAPADPAREITTLSDDYKFALDEVGTARLAATAADLGVTVNTVCQVVWGLLLGRLLGREDVVFGTTVSGRPPELTGVENMVGLFINTLPVRVEFAARDTIAEVLGRVQGEQADLLAHHYVGLADIHAGAGVGAEFDTLLVFESYPIDAAGIAAAGSIDGMRLTNVTMTNDTHYPLTVFATLTDRLEFTLQYLHGVFDPETIASFGARMQRILAAMAGDTSRPVGDIDLLDDTERALVVDFFNRTESPAEPATLIGMFDRQVAATPNAPAVTFGAETLTYAEFAGRIRRLARHLIDLGVGPEVLVALGMRRSLDLVTAMYAVLAAGGAYVPLDPDHPADRLEHILDTADPRCVLTTTADAFVTPGGRPTVVVDELELTEVSDKAIEPAERRGVLRPDNAAYVLFTSGSTGRPKGVSVSHTSVVNQIRWITAEYGIGANDVVLQKTPVTFDVSIWELFGPVIVGGRMVIATADGHRDPAYLVDVIDRERVTMTSFVPSMLSVFAEGAEPGSVDSLRSVLIAGEALAAHTVTAFRRISSAATYNLYGPTEFTVHATHSRVPDLVAGAVPIGGPVWNAQAYVLDSRLRPVPIGLAGELYLGGVQLARAYHRRAALTAERFVASPFAAAGPGGRLYRTGDLVRRHSDGKLEYLGRNDFQVKLRGLRIELGEIEALALQDASVSHAVALVRASPERADQLVCYLVPAATASIDVEQVRAGLAAELPEYMVPSAFVVISDLPLTTSGKLDRNALPEPELFSHAEFRSAGTDTERLLAAVFAEVLGLPDAGSVGVDADFFALGGDSISSIQLVSRAKTRGLVLTARDVFERRTVARLAEKAVAGSQSATVLGELPGGGVGTMPVPPVVRYMVERGGHFDRFNQTVTLSLPAGIDRAGVVATIGAVVTRHDMLRAALFRDAAGEWALAARPVDAIDVDSLVHRVDMPADEAARTELAAVELDAALERLDPADGVVLQFVWLDAPEAGRLVVAAHHLVVDGVSWRILITDFVTAWAQISTGAAPALPPVGTSMRRWAHALADGARTPACVAELGYWRGVLDGPDPALGARPFDPAIDVAQTLDAIGVRLDREVSAGVTTAVPEAFRGEVADGLLAALALAVREWRRRRGVDESSVLLRLEGHGREEHVAPGADLSRTVGWFTSMFPVRLDVSGVDLVDALAGGRSTGVAVKAVKEQLRSVPDKGIGFGMLRYANDDTAAQLADLATPQIGFNYLGRISAGELPEDVRDLSWTPVGDLGDLPARADADMPALAAIDINAIVTDGELSATFAFPRGLLDRESVQELADLWVHALDAVVRHARSVDTGGWTPSDFALVNTTQADIDSWETRFPGLTDLWSLSPLQAGFYFHSELASASLDVYTSQVVLAMTGAIDGDRLRRAGQVVVDRHANLRTAFVTDAAGAAVQVVLNSVELPWVQVDLSDEPDPDAALVALLEADRRDRFDMAHPPLLRFTLASLGDNRFRLLVTNHHILLDGWSMPLLMKDLLVLYATDGDRNAVEPVRPYRRYLEWLGEQDHGAARRAWRASLDGVTEPTLLAPRDTGRVIEALSGEHTVELDEAVTARLKEFAVVTGVTVNTVLQVAWAILLGRLVGRDDVVFGATVSGRPPEITGVESMVGLFINTVPVRVRVEPNDSVGQLLARVQSEQAGLLGQHYVGLADIVADVGPGAEFDSLFVYESYPVDTAGIAAASVIEGMQITGVDLTTVTHYPLTVLAVVGARLEITLQYLREIFGDIEISRIAKQFSRVLATIIGDPKLPVADIDLLDAAERQQVLRDWNATAAAIGDPRTLAGAIAESFARTPDAIAVIVPETEAQLTYREFGERVHRLAHWLIDRGVRPEARVGLAMRRSLDLLVAMYAVVEAGGAYVPIDPDHPAERTEYVLATAAPLLVLSTRRDDFAGTAVELIEELDLSDFPVTSVSDDDRRAPLRPENAAYVLFTSGSTGRPKGVVVRHDAVVNQLRWLTSEYALAPSDVVLLKTPATFDVSVWELFGTVLAGARLVVASPDGHRDPAYLADAIAAHGVTITSFVPSMLAAFAAAVRPGAVDSLRALLVAGEALTGPTVAAFQRVSAAPLFNLYGPTEYTVHATATPVERDVSGPVPIGTPVWNSAALVLDDRLRPTPVGLAGELYLAGAQLARGYDDRSALTAERFIANPHGSDGDRMYRTGDLVRWHESGVLEYLGRTDFQVKLRGQRIELGEIEAVLAAVPGVAAAVVAVHRGDRTGDQLVGYVVPAGDAVVESADAVAAAARRLPPYMVPSSVLVIDAMPLNSSGKIDRKSLPKPVFEAKVYRAPSTPIEEILAQTVAAVLDVERVGLDDNFFDLGGTSISATQVAARLGAELEAKVPVRLVFEAPTVAALAARLESHVGTRGHAALVAQPRPERVPLSIAQQRMWFLNRFAPESALYNIPVAVRLSGRLDVDALRSAVADLIERHEVLRTRYPEIDGAGWQVVADDPKTIPTLEIEACSAENLPARLGEFVSAGFDVAAAPPVRVTLFGLADDEFVLAFVAHHISADGYSMGPLTRDLMAAYVERARGERPDRPALAVQYADYTLWQHAVLGSADDPESLLSQQEAFWRETLRGLPDQLDLPTDRPRPVVSSNGGANVVFAIDGPLRARLRALATRHNVTMFMVMHSALAVLLSRLSATTDIAVGTPVAGRGDAALDDLIGMFVNTLVLRTDIEPDMSFAELLGRVRDVDVAAFGHADIPFERVVEVLNPVRSTARTPLFQVMLTFQNMSMQSFELPELRIDAVDFDVPLAKFDLQLTIADNPASASGADAPDAGLAAFFTYATDLFDETTVAGFADRLLRILEAVGSDADTAVGDLALTTPRERDTLLTAWNTPGAPVADTTLIGMFSHQAQRRGAAAALRFDGSEISYRELDLRSNRLARKLIDAGVGPESLVAIGTERGPAQIVAMLATMKAGAGYLPLDVTYPADRLSYILADAAPACVLTTAAERDLLPGTDARIIVLDGMNDASRDDAPITDAERIGPLRQSNVAYVIYTSGSTGRPKGVAVTHRNAVQLLANTEGHFGFDENDVWTMFHSFAFDFSVWEMWGALAYGGVLVIVDYLTSRSPEQFLELLVREQVTVLNQTPSAFYQLAEADRAAGSPDGLALRHVVFGGEALDLRQLRGWYERRPNRPQLVNMYGITETTVHVSYLALDSELAQRSLGSTIGRGLPGLATYVLDSRLEPVPVGVPGEVYVSGGQVSRGYVGRPDLVSARFIADPFAAPGARMYRTGDVARWNRDGQLEYAGRSDEQVQLRGFRIELGEVESVLLRYPGVAQAVASVRADDRLGDRLVGYVVAESDSPVDAADVRRHATEFLAAYMVPDAVLSLDELPLTPNGKLDRKALPAPEFTGTGAAYREPGTPIEQTVANVFAELLGAAQVGLDDDFFALGGNSLIATRAVARVNDALGKSIGVRALFEASTVAALAERVGAATTGARRPALVRAPRPDRIPLSLAQQRMWVINQADPDAATYNIPFAIRLTGQLDADALARAFGDLVERHEALRTRYPLAGDTPYQEILPAGEVRFDLTPVPVAAPEVRDRVVGLVTRPFDVTVDPPLRVELFAVGEDDLVLTLVVHHIAADGASMAPLVRDMMIAYAARAGGAAPSWSPLEIQYADYTLWQRAVLGSEHDPESVAAQQLAYWSTALSGLAEQFDLPTDRPRPPVPSLRGARFAFEVPEGAHVGLDRIARERNASLFMVIHAALAVLLARLSGSSDIAIGSPIAGRGERALDDLVGMFVNTLVLRTEVAPQAAFADLVERTREVDLTAFANADVPFESVVDAVRPARGRSSQLPQVMLVFQNLEPVQLEVAGLTVQALEPGEAVAKFDLQLTVEARHRSDGSPAGFGAVFTYATDLFDESTVDSFARRLVTIFEAVAEDPAAVVGDIDVLDETEQQLFEPAPEESATVRTGSIGAAALAQQLATVVEDDPDAPALSFGEDEMPYRELDGRSSQLGRAVIEAGGGPGDGVLVALNRGVDWAVAAWAVLKAGAAVVPVDPRAVDIASESVPTIGITTAAHVDRLAATAALDTVEWIVLDDPAMAERIATRSAGPITHAHRLRAPEASDLAYRDATGDGAVTVVELAALAGHIRERAFVDYESRTLHAGEPNVLAGLLELVVAGTAGATSVIPSSGRSVSGDTLDDAEITVLLASSEVVAALDPAALELLAAVVVEGPLPTDDAWFDDRVVLGLSVLRAEMSARTGNDEGKVAR